MKNPKIALLAAKMAEQIAIIEADKAQAAHDKKIDAMINEANAYLAEQRAARGIKTVITPWNTPINDILKGNR